MTKDTMAHVAGVSLGSALDYFHAAVKSERNDRAAFLILAHVQSVNATLLYAQLHNEDESFKNDSDFANQLEKKLRYEVYRMAEVGSTVGTPESFPYDEFLVRIAQDSISKHFEPTALTIGPQVCWEGPFANVAKGT